MCFEGDLHYSRYLEQVDEARTLVAAYLNAQPDEIGFTVNASSSATIVAKMLLRAGVARVYFPVGEFPTSVHAISNAGLDTHPVGSLDLKDSAPSWLEQIDRHMNQYPCGGKRAMVASHVCFLNGAALNIAEAVEFCKEREMLLVVNATQSFGALEIDVRKGVDMLYATGLKWMCAGYGAGFIYLRQGLVDDLGLPDLTGWLSVENPYRMDHANTTPISAARSLDAGGGMPHFGPLLSLCGALRLYEKIGHGDIRRGVTAVQRRTVGLATELRTSLTNAGFDVLANRQSPQASGIVSIVTDDAPELFDRLKKNNILTSLRTHPKTAESSILRFGIHFFNTKIEIDKVSCYKDAQTYAKKIYSDCFCLCTPNFSHVRDPSFFNQVFPYHPTRRVNASHGFNRRNRF